MRDGTELSAGDAAWLEAHLVACDRCKGFEADRQRLYRALAVDEPERAPAGFAGRALAAARSEPAQGAEARVESKPFALSKGLAFAGAAAAIAAFLVLAIVTERGADRGDLGRTPIERSGGGLPRSGAEDAHFVVRAPGVGAAAIRARVTALVDAHDGRYETGERAVLAHVPRSRLLRLLEDLARKGKYKVTKNEARDLGEDEETVRFRFELE